MVFDRESSDLEPELIVRYLQHAGWNADDRSKSIRRLSVPITDSSENFASETVEIFFRRSTSAAEKQRDVFFALRTISDYYEKELSILTADIRSLPYDQILSKIPNEYVSNDTIQLRVASEYINQMRNFLASSATTELTGERSFKRTKKEAIDYSEKCRFGHTFKGSFGFLIESPVGLNNHPSLPVVDEEIPLYRRIVERIASGLSSYSEAVKAQNPEVIAANSDGFSANMCDAMVDVIESTDVARLSIAIKLSPEWRSSHSSEKKLKFSIERQGLELLRVAAKSLRSIEDPKTVKVFGKIRRVETDGNPADLFEEQSNREVEINWINADDKLIHVKAMVSPKAYLDAIQAHREGKPVSATGLLVHSGRSWILEDIQDFRIIEV